VVIDQGALGKAVAVVDHCASAAIFAGRAGLRTAVIDNGDGLTQRALVDNHLGLPGAGS